MFATTACSIANNTVKPDNQPMVEWGSSEGIRRLEESNYKTDFFKLANHFESQHNKIFCGPTSAAIVLNSLRVRNGNVQIPEDKTLLNQFDLQYLTSKKWSPFFQRYTQNNVFLHSPKSREYVLGKISLDTQGKIIIDKQGKNQKDRGFQLRQLAELFRGHRLSVKVAIVNQELDDNSIKNKIIENLRTPNDYVIVNYKRGVLNQPGGGHISPLGAYHKASDSFLVMDVAPNKADWVWVKAALLIQAMRTFDTHENRGYLLIKEGR
ncbi:MAG: phytochelatin synthase family protein [Methyloprofundus sp.]|uniref:phytochelatin synthase family protein n=1 Tax=Methyloprofundus sp. TaxID=2020875 RepID=UPI00262DAFB2|nr:phytochelatin synthase family protein [Methyloprofundus sp.]